ncbi:leucine-rich repeat, cysteine-containing subtype protein, partial [Tanacetum coccineum]
MTIMSQHVDAITSLESVPDVLTHKLTRLLKGPVLKELYVDECFDLDAKHILPALLKLEQLEVLSVAHNESVDNSFIIKFVAAPNCTKFTDKALRAISKSCPGLCAVDLTNVCKLTDKSLAHLANGCPKIQILKFCRNTF